VFTCRGGYVHEPDTWRGGGPCRQEFCLKDEAMQPFCVIADMSSSELVTGGRFWIHALGPGPSWEYWFVRKRCQTLARQMSLRRVPPLIA